MLLEDLREGNRDPGVCTARGVGVCGFAKGRWLCRLLLVIELDTSCSNMRP